MPLFTVILAVSIVAKNSVNVTKMLTVKAQALDAVWLLLSGVFGGLIVWALDFQVNIFSFMGVETTTRISINFLPSKKIQREINDIFNLSLRRG